MHLLLMTFSDDGNTLPFRSYELLQLKGKHYRRRESVIYVESMKSQAQVDYSFFLPTPLHSRCCSDAADDVSPSIQKTHMICQYHMTAKRVIVIVFSFSRFRRFLICRRHSEATSFTPFTVGDKLMCITDDAGWLCCVILAWPPGKYNHYRISFDLHTNGWWEHYNAHRSPPVSITIVMRFDEFQFGKSLHYTHTRSSWIDNSTYAALIQISIDKYIEHITYYM